MIDAKTMSLVSRRDDYKTSHVLHLLLSVFTLGIWVPVWIIVTLSNAIERGKIDRELGKV